MFKPTADLVRKIDKFMQEHDHSDCDELPDRLMQKVCEKLGVLFARRIGVIAARQRDFTDRPEFMLIENGHFTEAFFSNGSYHGDLWEIPRIEESAHIYEMIAREFTAWLREGENTTALATAHVTKFVVTGDSVCVQLKPSSEEPQRDRSRTPTVTFE